MNAVAREIPIADFFKDPEFSSVRLSPDGKHLAVVMPQNDRSVLVVMNAGDKKVIGRWDYGENRHFRQVLWANDRRLLFRVTIKTGRFDYEVGMGDLYASNIDGSNRIDIQNGAYYQIVDMTPDDPDTILVSRSIEGAYLFKLNVNNGRVTTVATAPVDGGSFLVDHEGRARYAYGEMQDGRQVTYRRDGDSWSLLHESPRGGATYKPLGFAADDKHAYFAKGENGKPEAIVLVDPDTEQETVVSDNGTVDPDGMLWSSDHRSLIAVHYTDGLPDWDFIEPATAETRIYAGLAKAFPGKGVLFGGVSQDGRLVAVQVYADRDPGQVYLFDTLTGKATYLLSSMEWIKPAEMATMKPVTVTARDGIVLHGYLTVPNGSDGKNLPLIVNPHGGPHGIRDDWGFNPEVQLLANRGYAVLQMNYRGSGGYGNAFERAGYRKWGTAMQDDLTDSVRWAVRQGIADADRVCIYGASYGGYAAIMSVVREPDLYKCAVGYAGVYDLDIQKSDSDTAGSKYGRSYLNDVYPETVAERRAQSPAYGVDRIKTPIMLVHGGKDMRVPIKNMNFLISQLKSVGKQPVDVVTESKEAHGFRDLNNNVNLYTHMLSFFDRYIGSKAADKH